MQPASEKRERAAAPLTAAEAGERSKERGEPLALRRLSHRRGGKRRKREGGRDGGSSPTAELTAEEGTREGAIPLFTQQKYDGERRECSGAH